MGPNQDTPSAPGSRRHSGRRFVRHRLVVWAAVGLVAAVAAPVSSVPAALAAPGDITTVAGNGDGASYGDGGPATSAAIHGPYGVTVGGADTYVSENLGDLVRRVAGNGVISTVAGGGTVPLGDGGPATSASLSHPNGVALDSHGNLFVSDTGNNLVRKVDASGTITTVAGGGTDLGDGGPATSAKLDSPTAIAVDGKGNLFIAEEGTNRVRKVDPSGIITTVAGNGSDEFNGDGIPATSAGIAVRGLAVDAAGNLLIADVNGRIRRVDAVTGIITTVAGTGGNGSTGDGGPATAAEIGFPEDVTVDAAGNLYISSVVVNVVRKVDTAGVISTVAGGGSPPDELGDGGPATAAALDFPQGAVGAASGDVTIADTNHNRIRKVSAGVINTIAGRGTPGFSGDGGPAVNALLDLPRRLVLDAAGNLYFADGNNNRVRRIDPQGIITTVAGGGVGDGLPATSSALNRPEGLTVDGAGNLLIADCGNGRVRKVDLASQVISTVAGGGQPPGGVGDGLPATAAALVCPSGLFSVGAGSKPAPGTLFIADCGDNRVRRVDPSGVITTVAGTGTAGFNGDNRPATATQLNCPSDVRVDGAGNVFIADSGNNRVRRVDAARGRVVTVAGDGATGFGSDGRATAAHVNYPTGLAFDGAGSLLIAENRHARVRKVDRSGTITTVAGTGVPGFSGDGGPATQATLGNPTQVAFDAVGNLLITDGFAPVDLTEGNNRLRRVEAGTPTTPAAGCGAVLTRSTTLTADIGPCSGDGIIVGADNITLDLGGHRVLGAGPGDGSHPGIRLNQRKGVTVRNGTVTGFAAGVAVLGGARNTLTALTITGNVGPAAEETPEFGDGIALFFSSGNQVVANTVSGNGNYDGIFAGGLGANGNAIQGNTVSDNIGPGIIANPFFDINLPGRGGSLQGNNVIGNTVRRNRDAGISNISNRNARISDNVVEGNGSLSGVLAGGSGAGIGVASGAAADPVTNDVLDRNIVTGSYSDGIQVNTMGNWILDNTSTGNATGGFGFDLHDTTDPPCADNRWVHNVWGSAGFDPACTANGGHPARGTAPHPTSGATLDSAARPGPSLDPSLPRRHLAPADAALATRVLGGG